MRKSTRMGCRSACGGAPVASCTTAHSSVSPAPNAASCLALSCWLVILFEGDAAKQKQQQQQQHKDRVARATTTMQSDDEGEVWQCVPL